MSLPTFYIGLFWLCYILFILRVLGQVYVAIYQPPFLPPMKQWYSGLLPYHWLLPSQIIIIIWMALISYDFSRKAGFFYVTESTTGKRLIILSSLYFGFMIFRYIRRMLSKPEERWLGGTIPIIFHSILALYIFLCGSFQFVLNR